MDNHTARGAVPRRRVDLLQYDYTQYISFILRILPVFSSISTISGSCMVLLKVIYKHRFYNSSNCPIVFSHVLVQIPKEWYLVDIWKERFAS
jgi:hypothetical protein